MTTAPELHPFFLAGASGPLFAVFHSPEASRFQGECFVFIPPFGEELNRSRRAVVLQAQKLASMGIGVLVLDLFGCGDSGGEIADATWEHWLNDIDAAAGWLERERGATVALWGLRLGAALAVAAADRHPQRYSRLLLWEPVIYGEAFLTQVLRSRIAAAMTREEEVRETTGVLRQQLKDGESLEVAGYTITPVMAANIDAVDLAALLPRCTADVHWIEIAGDAARPLSEAARRVIERWRQAGISVHEHVEKAPRFWSLIETTIAPDLVAATCRQLGVNAP